MSTASTTAGASRMSGSIGRSSSLPAMSSLVAGGARLRCRGTAGDALTQALEDDVQHGNDEDAKEGGGNHAAEHRRADGATAGGAGACGDDQGQEAEDEGEARHRHRAEAQPRALDGRVEDVLA